MCVIRKIACARTSAERLVKAAEDIAARRGLKVTWEAHLDQASVAMDAPMAAMLDRALEQSGAPTHRMFSGAGHDAMILAGKHAGGNGVPSLRETASATIQPKTSAHDDVAAALELDCNS